MTLLWAILLGLLIAAGIVTALYYVGRDEARRQHATYEAQCRAWSIQQQEYETEQRIREATRSALDQMLTEARRHNNE